MGKKAKNNSKRIKTSHKKGIVKRKTAYSHVDPSLTDVNRFIDAAHPRNNNTDTAPKVEPESMTVEELQKLLGGTGPKRPTKLSVDDANYVEPLVRKYGDNYERAVKDAKLNRMQWTANQLRKKHAALNLLNQELSSPQA